MTIFIQNPTVTMEAPAVASVTSTTLAYLGFTRIHGEPPLEKMEIINQVRHRLAQDGNISRTQEIKSNLKNNYFEGQSKLSRGHGRK